MTNHKNNESISLESLAGSKKGKAHTKKQLKNLLDDKVTVLSTKVSILEQLLHNTMVALREIGTELGQVKGTTANLLDLMTIRLSALSAYLSNKKIISEDEIQPYIKAATDEANAMREKYIDLERKLVTVDREAALNDTIIVNFDGTVDGQPFAGGSARGQYIKLGSKNFIDGFEDQLVGIRPGESRTITVKFPDSYHEDTLRGKEGQFQVSCLRVKESAPDPDKK